MVNRELVTVRPPYPSVAATLAAYMPVACIPLV